LPSRRDTRNRQFPFVQIKNSSKTESPLRSGGFGTAGEAEGSPEFGSRPRTLGFPLIKCPPIKRVPPGKLGNQRTLENHRSTRREDPRADTPLWSAKLLGAMLRTTYQQLRIGLPSLVPDRRLSDGLALSGHIFESRGGKPALPGPYREAFPQVWSTIGGATGDSVNSHFRLKNRRSSYKEEQMP